MAQSDLSIEKYYSINRDKMIDCPFQPGNLKISRRACLKRYKVARQNKHETLKVENLFSYFVSQGLARCQVCPVIEHPVSRA